jgi:hypothetical protein
MEVSAVDPIKNYRGVNPMFNRKQRAGASTEGHFHAAATFCMVTVATMPRLSQHGLLHFTSTDQNVGEVLAASIQPFFYRFPAP